MANIASGHDRVAVQIGRITGRQDTAAAPDTANHDTGAVNVREGNATVGAQYGDLTGDTFWFTTK